MPTNILRHRAKPRATRIAVHPSERRLVVITAGGVTVRAELTSTLTAARIAEALPLFATAERWGDALHFEIPVSSGRERGARLNASAGDICFWSSDSRVIIGFGPTPISRLGEIRLPEPCNLWARAIDDVTQLKAVRPGEKVVMTAISASRA